MTSTVNSTFTPLAANAIFTGTFESVKDFATITVTLRADASGNGANALAFQWSTNGIDIDFEEATSLTANVGRGFAITARAEYFRIEYRNGATAQTLFHLGVVYHASGTGLISRPLGKNLTDDNFAQTVRAVLCAKKADGSYVNLKATDDGKLIVKVKGLDSSD